jgi:hypothetical protein
MNATSQDTHLDFVVIGAQKAGTTTLFEHLRFHPSLYLPPSKEAAFFNRSELHKRGVDYFFTSFFADAPTDALWGTVTPGYMCDPGVPARLGEAFPDIRIIAILRDPVERSWSHFRMSTRRGLETRSYSQAISDQLDPDQVVLNRRSLSETDTYVAWGEYGRILSNYRQHFPAEQILVVSTHTLERSPETVLAAVYRFLAVPAIWPPDLGRHYHVGGDSERIPHLQQRAENRTLVRWVWHRFSQGHRDLIFERINRWNANIASAAESGVRPHLSCELLDRLERHFAGDHETLRQALGVGFEWPSRGEDWTS